MSDEERELRRLLWLRHGCPHSALYGDDGEMQCAKCLLDFQRDSALEIGNRWRRAGWLAWKMPPAPPPAPAPAAGQKGLPTAEEGEK